MQNLTVLDMIKWWMLFIYHQQDALPCLILFILSFHKCLLGSYHIPGNVQGTEDTLWHRQKKSLIRWWQGLKRIQVGGVTASASGPRLPERSARTLEVKLKEAPSCKQQGGRTGAGSIRRRGGAGAEELRGKELGVFEDLDWGGMKWAGRCKQKPVHAGHWLSNSRPNASLKIYTLYCPSSCPKMKFSDNMGFFSTLTVF